MSSTVLQPDTVYKIPNSPTHLLLPSTTYERHTSGSTCTGWTTDYTVHSTQTIDNAQCIVRNTYIYTYKLRTPTTWYVRRYNIRFVFVIASFIETNIRIRKKKTNTKWILSLVVPYIKCRLYDLPAFIRPPQWPPTHTAICLQFQVCFLCFPR
jgi:hypothetical protein